IYDLIKQIGDSIKECLAANTERSSTSITKESSHTTVEKPEPINSSLPDLSKLSLVLKSDVKEPLHFKGDESDKYSIGHWIGVMETYLKKKGFTQQERAEEVLCKLVGRARDIVKVSLRNNSSFQNNKTADVLKQHFSDVVYSNMPLADFYETKPKQNKGPVEYWIRLNKAAEIVEECFKTQGNILDDQSLITEVMFIRNCPDKELAYVFKSKPVSKWTGGEVQERLDEYQRERKANANDLACSGEQPYT
ncbi:hypothetical protein HHUSO_G5409, partial [Huso huso]